MDSETRPKLRRDLNPVDFQRLLTRLDPDPERASAQYTRLRERLIRYSWSHDELISAEELADKALDELARKPDLESIGDVEQFAVGIMRMLLMAYRRQKPLRAAEEPEGLGHPSPEASIVHRLDQERKQRCFVNCLKNLSPVERRLIFEYYPNEGGDLEGRRKQLARMVGVEPGTLATRMNRLRARLERCCLSCYRRSLVMPAAQNVGPQLKKL